MSSSLTKQVDNLVRPLDKQVMLDTLIPLIHKDFKQYFTMRIRGANTQRELEWFVDNIKIAIGNKTL